MLGFAFIGGEGPGPDFCRLLAGGAGLIVAADSGLQIAENAGIRPDWIIGDMDSLDDPRRLEKYPAGKVRVLLYISQSPEILTRRLCLPAFSRY